MEWDPHVGWQVEHNDMQWFAAETDTVVAPHDKFFHLLFFFIII